VGERIPRQQARRDRDERDDERDGDRVAEPGRDREGGEDALKVLGRPLGGPEAEVTATSSMRLENETTTIQ